jgi:hypothetical protein
MQQKSDKQTTYKQQPFWNLMARSPLPLGKEHSLALEVKMD